MAHHMWIICWCNYRFFFIKNPEQRRCSTCKKQIVRCFSVWYFKARKDGRIILFLRESHCLVIPKFYWDLKTFYWKERRNVWKEVQPAVWRRNIFTDSSFYGIHATSKLGILFSLPSIKLTNSVLYTFHFYNPFNI